MNLCTCESEKHEHGVGAGANSILPSDNVKENNGGSWANLKGGGKLTVKEGKGQQMRGMVPGLGSVSGCPRPTPR